MRSFTVCILVLLLVGSCKKDHDTLPPALEARLNAGDCNPPACMFYFQAVEFEGQRNNYYYLGIEGQLCDRNPNGIFYYAADGTPIENGSELHNRLAAEGVGVGRKWKCNGWK